MTCTTEKRKGGVRPGYGLRGPWSLCILLCAAAQACGGDDANSGGKDRSADTSSLDAETDRSASKESGATTSDTEAGWPAQPTPTESGTPDVDATPVPEDAGTATGHEGGDAAAVQDGAGSAFAEGGTQAEGGQGDPHDAGQDAARDSQTPGSQDAAADGSPTVDCTRTVSGPRAPSLGRSEAFSGTEADYNALATADCSSDSFCVQECQTRGGSADTCAEHSFCSPATDKCAAPTYWLQPNLALAESPDAACVIPRACAAYVATVSFRNNPASYQDALDLTGFGLDVPTGAMIHGIKFDVRRQSDSGCAMDASVRILKNGAEVGVNHAQSSTPWSSQGFEHVTYGDQNDLWGGSWTAEDVDATGFGISLRAVCFNASDQAMIDSVQATVYFTPAGC